MQRSLLIWFVIPVPQGVSPDAWHLLALFIGIIAGIIGKAMPIGAMAILGITLVALTGVTNEKNADATKDALSSLNNSLIWMIGIAIIISRGLLKTGLGMRIGYLLISLFGKRTLGVGYSLALADLVIGPVTPSNTARGGAIVHPPEIKQTPNATALAKEHLAAMGPMKREEKIMLGIFLVLLLLWAGIPEMLFGVKVDATATTFLGLSLCLLTGILTWEDALKEKSAWDTIVWFAALVMMANFLNKLGLISWLSDSMQSGIAHMGLGWEAGCALLMLAYLYAHYVFASGTAHVTAMFGAFYGAGLALGAPPMLFALVMASATGIMMSLTHYATGSAPVIYGSNYVSMTEWWKAGFIMSVLEILIFGTVGILWWKVLGYW